MHSTYCGQAASVRQRHAGHNLLPPNPLQPEACAAAHACDNEYLYPHACDRDMRYRTWHAGPALSRRAPENTRGKQHVTHPHRTQPRQTACRSRKLAEWVAQEMADESVSVTNGMAMCCTSTARSSGTADGETTTGPDRGQTVIPAAGAKPKIESKIHKFLNEISG